MAQHNFRESDRDTRTAETLRLEGRSYNRQTCVDARRESPEGDINSESPISEIAVNVAAMPDKSQFAMVSGSTIS